MTSRVSQGIGLAIIIFLATACGSANADRSAPPTTEDTTAPAAEATPSTVPPTVPTTAAPITCPGPVSWDQAAQHMGETQLVQGSVRSVSYHPETNGAPTFVNIGADYPDPARFQVVVWGDDRGAFPGGPEAAFTVGSTTCVTGAITSYNGVAQMEISMPAAIWAAGAVSAQADTSSACNPDGDCGYQDYDGYEDYEEPDPCDISDCDYEPYDGYDPGYDDGY